MSTVARSTSPSPATTGTGRYVREFDLAHRYYPRRERILRWLGDTMYTPEMLADPKVLDGFGLNRREVDYIVAHSWPELAGLYYQPYVDAFGDEYKPFGVGLDHLDGVTTTELFRKDGASDAALRMVGGGGSALQSIWHAAILKIRGVPLFPKVVYRLVGGNQKLPDAFAERLGARVRTKSPVTAIEHGQTGVKVTCKENGRTVVHEADYLVCATSAFMLRHIPIAPALPPEKAWAIANVPYYHDTRPIFQTRTKFWEKESLTAAMEFNVPELNHVWATCDEVETPRGLIVGTATGPQTPERALAAYKRLYPGKQLDVEKARAVVWATNPWASACETTAYEPGTLKKFWPALVEPHGRIQFCGAYADNLNWGQEAATRSAFRVAEAIDKA